MQIFARLTKVNEADRTIEGVIASEAVDRSGEVFDYEKSKPHFEAWSQGIAKATDGKNLGNVRVMHGKHVAGVTKQLDFDDKAKHIAVKAEIVDDNEWNKVLKGCYTGFSIGGRYGSKWEDPVLKAQRYEAIPSEYSLVDLPCNPDAQFTVIKSDGSEELRKFETTDDAEALAKWADGLTDEQAATLLAKIARRNGVDPKEGTDKYGDVEYADEANKKYPLDSAKHIKAAWSYIHMPKNAGKYSAEDAGTIKRKIVAAWKAKVDSKGPPEAEKFAAFADMLEKALADDDDAMLSVAEAFEGDLAKVGRKHTKAQREHRAAIAEHLAKAKEHLDAMAADDPANDPDDDGDDDEAEKLAKAAGELAKVTAERDEIKAQLDEIKAQLDEINAAAADLRKQLGELPAPPKGCLTAVDKTIGLPQGDGKEPVEIKKSDGSIDHAATALELAKAAYKNPIRA
ncbi:MAG: hypothetical protein KGL35_31520 [Bradyrhizobium sp.]|nr:hypothetical protein [Bradyrhizobium sp.]